MFSDDFVPNVWIFRRSRRYLWKNECMHKSVESMYESVCRIVMSGRSPMCQAEEVRDLYEGAGSLSERLDNMFYERMGMSCEELIEALQRVIINKSC